MSFAGVTLLGSGEVVDVPDAPDGDAARVLDAFTAIESLVLKEVFDPVRKANAASRLGRGAGAAGALPPLAIVALLLRRAASWLREGGRALLDFFIVVDGAAVVEESAFVGLIVYMDSRGQGKSRDQTQHNGIYHQFISYPKDIKATTIRAWIIP